MTLPRAHSRLRILQVEDSDDDAELVRLELESAGVLAGWHRVQTEEEFVAALDDGEWDVVISDFQMPAFDGLRAFALFRARGLDSPFIFVSGALPEDIAIEAMRAGVRDFVPKDKLARLPICVARELEAVAGTRRLLAAQQHAREEQRRLAAAVEASRAGIFEHTVPFESELFASDRCFEMLGYPRDEVPGPDELPVWLAARVHPDDLGAAREGYTHLLDGRDARFVVDARVRHRSGSWLHVTAFVKALTGRDARVERVVGVVLDESPRRMLEERLRQSQKMEAIGQLAGGVAHDFNNLLTAISGFAQFAVRRLGDDHPARPDIDHVVRAAKRAERLTGQLLAFSRRKEVQPRAVDLNTAVSELEPMLRTLIGEDVEIRLCLADDLWPATIDPTAVDQVVVNLAVNARDAMPDGGCITIETSNATLDESYGLNHGARVPPGEYTLLVVSDTGIGMPPEILERIFEPFFTTKATGKGTGLGLSTCYGIVKQAGGYLWAYSEPGLGTTFKVYLPRADRPAVQPAPPLELRTISGTETVLVAEDDAQVRELVVQTLRGQGYRVLEAASGEDAMTIAAHRGDEIDLLLSDVIMTDCSGPRIAEQLVIAWPRMRVLFMSGYTANVMAERGLLTASAKILRKPFMPADLLREVRQVLGEPSTEPRGA
jgi:two-component system cell cycle sensor histidine kinase/response regulator CckA